MQEWFEKEKLKEEQYSKPLYFQGPKEMSRGLVDLVPERLGITEGEI